MDRLTLWLRKHLVIVLEKENSTLENQCRSKPSCRTGPETGLTTQSAKNTDLAVERAEYQDWRVPIISYLKDLSCGAERSIRRAAFKYILIDNELYRRTAEYLLLKCLDPDKAKVAM